MANNCSFNMKVVADNIENINKFISELQDGNTFYRVFSAEAEAPCKEGARYSACIFGDCAWSVYCSMIDVDDNTYATLETESERLGLEIEVFSTEPGLCFAEHYIYKKGFCILESETEYHEYWPEGYDSWDEFANDSGCPYTEEELNGEPYIIGGYNESFQI